MLIRETVEYPSEKDSWPRDKEYKEVEALSLNSYFLKEDNET